MESKCNLPKVLVISHNSFSNTQNNGKTLSSFFKGWDKSKIAQLYFWGELPDFDVCEEFFRVTDYEILDSYIGAKDVKGEIIKYNEIQRSGEVKTSIVKKIVSNRGSNDRGIGIHKLIKIMFSNNMPLALIVRDIMWNSKMKKSNKLTEWVDNYKPEVIFLQCSNGTFPYRIAMNIAKKYNIPLIIQFTDDYLTARKFMLLFAWIHHFKLLKEVKQAISYSSSIFAIGDVMAEEYKTRFGGNYETFMNTVDVENEIKEDSSNSEEQVVKFIYAGSLHTNRWKTLSKIGSALEKLNKDGVQCKFDIYTNKKPEKEQLDAITYQGVMEYKGNLSPVDLDLALKQYDVLVHVEAFDKKSKHITRLSISTKIPEYLSKKKAMLAIGPLDIASIKYVKDNDVAHVISDLDEINMIKELSKIIIDHSYRNEKVSRGYELAKKRHDAINNRIRIKNIIESSCKTWQL